jgi:hypothetical protein
MIKKGEALFMCYTLSEPGDGGALDFYLENGNTGVRVGKGSLEITSSSSLF